MSPPEAAAECAVARAEVVSIRRDLASGERSMDSLRSLSRVESSSVKLVSLWRVLIQLRG